MASENFLLMSSNRDEWDGGILLGASNNKEHYSSATKREREHVGV